MAAERQPFTINSKQNKNKGIIYDGYLLPHFVIKKNAKGDLVINKPKTSAISAEYAEQYKELIEDIDTTYYEDYIVDEKIDRHNSMSLEDYYDTLVKPILKEQAKQGAKLKKFVSVNYDRTAIASDLYKAMKKEFVKDMGEQKKLLEHSQFNLTPRKGKGDETEFNFNAFKNYQSGIQASYEQSSAKKKLKFAKKKAKVAEAGEKKSKKKAKSAKKELERVKAETEKTIAQKKEGLEQAKKEAAAAMEAQRIENEKALTQKKEAGEQTKREAAAAMEAQRIENEKALAQKKEAGERTKAQTTKALRDAQEKLKTIEDEAIKERGQARKRLRGARKKAQEDKVKALEEVNAEKAAALEKAKVEGEAVLEKAKSEGEEALKKAQKEQQEQMKQALERAKINREAAEREAEAQASLALAEAQRVSKEALERADINKAAALEKQQAEAQKILQGQKAKSEAEFARIEAKRKFDLKASKEKFDAEKKALADANQAEIRGIKTGKKMALDQTKKAAEEAMEAQRIENRKALRGARAKGEEEVAKVKEENRARLYRAFEKTIETGAERDVDNLVVGDIIKRYFEEGRSREETQEAVDALRPPDEQQQKQLVGTEEETMNQPLKPAAVAAVAVDDEEYEAPDSAAAAAAVAPVESSLNTGAGSAAPPPPLPPPPPVPAAVAGGVPPRPRQPFLPVPQVAPVQPPQPPPLVEGQTIKQQGVSPEERSENISLQIKEQEKGDGGTKTDDNLDVSKYGYDKQVSIFAIQEDRDFTYSQTLVKSQNTNIKEGLMDALRMWGYTIEINKPKTTDEAEALEIRTFIFLAKEKYALERRWKKALTELPEALDDIGFSGQETATAATGAGQQMGLITQFADPQVFANFVNQAATAGAGGGGGQGRQPAGQMAGQAAMARAAARPTPPSTPYPPNIPLRRTTTEEDLRRVAGELSRQSSAQSAETKSGTEGFSTDAEGYGGFMSAEDSDDFSRRRLTGFGREVGYTNKPDRIQRTERVAQGGQGVQRVRVARPQKAKPKIPKQRRLDTRPKMNVKKAEFKMRRSRINPNLLFTNLTKQNPSLVGTLPLFKTRTTEPIKKVRFLKG